MSPTTPDGVDAGADETYIRGGATVSVSWTRVLTWTAGICLVSMAAVTIGLTVAAADNTSRLQRLKRHGTPVTARVTSCLGILSGTGVTVVGFRCSALFAVAGAEHTEDIHDSNTNLAPGTPVPCYVLADEPATLTLASAVDHQAPRWHAFVAPIVLGAITVIGTVLAVLFLRRPRATSPIRGSV